MDYSQFLKMPEELSLLFVLLLTFIADLFLCSEPTDEQAAAKRGNPIGKVAIVLLTLSTLLNFLPEFNGSQHAYQLFGGMYQHTPMMTVVKSILAVGTIIVFLMADSWMRRTENQVKQGEFYIVTMFTLLGMYFMISSGHFLMFFIGLEMASVPMAALIAFDKYRYESAEAAAKFILLALFSSALLVYGLSLIYGMTGTLYYSGIAQLFAGNTLLGALALLLFISGMGFKISLVPFHLWTADTYEGAPTTVTGYLSVISKSSAAFVLLLVLQKTFVQVGAQEVWNVALYWIIIASITIANLFAIQQNNLKRFMAFSAISQAGYIALGIMGGTAQGMTALVYYVLVYMAANLGAFAVINAIEQKSNKILISDYDGLYATNPKLSFLMTLCLFSLAGIPPFAGMFSKFFIFMAAFDAGYPWLVLIALVNTVLSLYYYLVIVKAMYINKNDHAIATFKTDTSSRIALFLCLAGVVVLGVGGVFYNYLDTLSYGLDKAMTFFGI